MKAFLIKHAGRVGDVGRGVGGVEGGSGEVMRNFGSVGWMFGE